MVHGRCYPILPSGGEGEGACLGISGRENVWGWWCLGVKGWEGGRKVLDGGGAVLCGASAAVMSCEVVLSKNR